jgi:hypothetical protein
MCYTGKQRETKMWREQNLESTTEFWSLWRLESGRTAFWAHRFVTPQDTDPHRQYAAVSYWAPVSRSSRSSHGFCGEMYVWDSVHNSEQKQCTALLPSLSAGMNGSSYTQWECDTNMPTSRRYWTAATNLRYLHRVKVHQPLATVNTDIPVIIMCD